MKRSLKRSTLILIFTIAFIVGIGFFTVELAFNARDWVAQPYNAHISGNGGLEEAGRILDRNGTVLAETVDGERVYNNDSQTRMALLHTVGDNSLNISTAVQSKYRSLLTGYNLIWGLNMPQSMCSSRDITLTVDAETCKTAFSQFQNLGKHGACVIYNYQTGEVICSVSTPGYDPQYPPTITEDNESEYEGVYLDNVLSSSYTPGSIFKLVTAVCAIENMPDALSHTHYCAGSEEIGGHDVTCSDNEVHGEINLQQALEHSCNIYFADLAVELGSEKMNATAEKMGINMSFDIDDVDTAKGHYDSSSSDTNQLGWSGVGQYDDKVNPMQMAIVCSAIANSGKGVNPTYIKSGSDDILKEIGITGHKTYDLINSGTAQTLDSIMPVYNIGDLTVHAKTGTAEVNEDKAPNAWFVGYSTNEDCPLAFACIVEDAGFGNTYARPIVEAALTQAATVVRNGS